MAYVLRHHRTKKGSEGKLRHSTQQAIIVSAESPSLGVMHMTQGQKVRALRGAVPPRNSNFLSQSHIVALLALNPRPPGWSGRRALTWHLQRQSTKPVQDKQPDATSLQPATHRVRDNTSGHRVSRCPGPTHV